ncbi:AfsR/SARP family transcriptional regulator [Modestobacter italicus]|uniref:AfsR/SARP family transcriptional regulator n=1 Tax=Modestobacter italicus (strain DSM 44449 / CECT 9708 / BC 501) TaxID=2732864 RepID=UPI001C97DDFF|nr:BTAD domain-containing putative transcriptional regulator [Modestobacter italicus]
MRYRDLGPLVIEVDGADHPPPGPKPAALLAALLVNVNRRVSVPALLEVVWGDHLTAKAEATLESHVWRLRRLLEPSRPRGRAPAVLVNDSGGYRLLARPEQIDSARFEQLADETRTLAGAGDPADLLARCEEALALWRGAPYQQVAEQEWAAPFLARLEEMATELRERRIDALLATGSTDRALRDVAGLIEQTPFRERLWAQRMLGLYRAGRVEESLQAYRRARDKLLDELGAEPGTDLQTLHRRVLDQDPALDLPRPVGAGTRTGPGGSPDGVPPDGVPARATHPVEVHLPARADPLIGRRSDLDALGDLVTTRQLVTVTGAAGCGKTRLAVEVAATVAGAFPDGVWFVDLAAVDRPELVLDVVVTTIGFAAPAVGNVVEALRSYTRDRRMLLVLDNAEHLLPAVADVVTAVQADDSRCALLVTSREPIATGGELIWPLGPLPFDRQPDPLVPEPTADTEEPAPAVELFLARAQAADPMVVIDEEAMQTVRRICRRLDGLPLAIELAAARVRSATLPEIAEQVSADASALRRLGRATADHRQSVRAAIEWSHRLLSCEEQAVHRRLSVLPGPFTRPAAAAVAGVDPVATADVPELLAMLTHRSLLTPLRAGRAGGPSLFSQLATVRGHAAHALTAADETDAAVRRRDAWVAGLLAGRPRVSRPGGDFYDAVADAYPTVRATLHRVLVDEPDAAAGGLLSALTMFWYYRAHSLEGQRWLRLALGRHELTPPDAALAHLALTAHALLRGRSDLAGPHLDAALGLVPTVPGDRLVDLAEVMGAVALAAELQQAYDQTELLLAAVAELAAATGDADVALVSTALALLPTPSAAGDHSADEADDLHRQACAEENGLAAWVAATAAARRARTPEDALRWTDRQVELQVLLGAQDSGLLAELRAGLMVAAGQDRDAVRLFAAARLYLRRAGLNWPMIPTTRELMRQAHQRLGAVAYEQAWDEGGRRQAPELMAELRG